MVNGVADAAETMVRISMDAKASVKVGPFARGGKSRVPTSPLTTTFTQTPP